MTSAPAIGFEYRPSRLFARVLVLVALLAATAVLLCGLSVWLKVMLLLIVGIGAWRAIRAHLHLQVTAAGWASDGSWTLHRSSAEDVPAILASHRALGAFVLLRFALAGRGRAVILLAPDNSDADIRRRLRMRLAAGQPDEAAPSP